MSSLSQGAWGTVVWMAPLSENRVSGGEGLGPGHVGFQHLTPGERRRLQKRKQKNPGQKHKEENQPESQGKQVFVGRDTDQGTMLPKGRGTRRPDHDNDNSYSTVRNNGDRPSLWSTNYEPGILFIYFIFN